jgi:hypothetical protein
MHQRVRYLNNKNEEEKTRWLVDELMRFEPLASFDVDRSQHLFGFAN